ncbi:hypothetical protein [uncultured Lactobacillus sp.]|uniref:hypothetical protein n=1 Tax=uncultured Lactobacillus sp. TaxID=153152 RepID=UPI00261E8D6F|nr:hypothetical protein [uncultured Lactobacillus sp.]
MSLIERTKTFKELNKKIEEQEETILKLKASLEMAQREARQEEAEQEAKKVAPKIPAQNIYRIRLRDITKKTRIMDITGPRYCVGDCELLTTELLEKIRKSDEILKGNEISSYAASVHRGWDGLGFGEKQWYEEFVPNFSLRGENRVEKYTITPFVYMHPKVISVKQIVKDGEILI